MCVCRRHTLTLSHSRLASPRANASLKVWYTHTSNHDHSRNSTGRTRQGSTILSAPAPRVSWDPSPRRGMGVCADEASWGGLAKSGCHERRTNAARGMAAGRDLPPRHRTSLWCTTLLAVTAPEPLQTCLAPKPASTGLRRRRRQQHHRCDQQTHWHRCRCVLDIKALAACKER